MSQRVSRSSALGRLARAAVARVGGARLVAEALAGDGDGRPMWVLGAGKAVGAMAEGAKEVLADRARFGVLLGKHESTKKSSPPLRVGGHPLPDARGVAATHQLITEVAIARPGDRVLFLLSGGASALLAAPIDGVTLEQLRAATARLLAAGEPIDAINTLRRHLGRALGGRLALASSADIDVLALSDVVGDHPAAIGSGPLSPDPSTWSDALAVGRRAGLSGDLLAVLERGARGQLPETPKPGDPCFGRVRYRILATPETLRAAAAEEARRAGFSVEIEPELVRGDVRDLARRYADRIARLATGTLLIAVGEPTVRVTGDGRGGRAQHLALEMARLLDERAAHATFLALGSDGSDGPTDAAGALVDGTTWSSTLALHLDPDAALARFDAYPLLDAVGALLRTGPTGTNLLDLHLLHRPS